MKKLSYIILTTILGILFGFMVHAGIEMLYLDWAEKNNAPINWINVFGQNLCALPIWLVYLLLVLGVIFGIWLGFYWWKKVYGESQRLIKAL